MAKRTLEKDSPTGKIRLNGDQKKVLAAGFIFILVFVFVALNGRYKSLRFNQEAEAKIEGENIASAIQAELKNCVRTTELIEDLYLVYGEEYLKDFYRISDELCDDDIVIGSMYFAPNAVIKYSYPDIVDEATGGFHMLEDPIQGPKSQLAIDTRRVTVAGPHELIEGGQGFIIRNPIFDKYGKFEAFAILVLDKDLFFRQLMETSRDDIQKYHFAIRKLKDETAVLDANGYIFSNTDQKIDSDISIPFMVPNDLWHLTLEPVDGWVGLKEMLPDILVAVIFIILATSILYFILHTYRHRQLMKQAVIDAIEVDELTGLYTKQAFTHYAKGFIEKYEEDNLDILIADIQNFKLVNSIYGEENGDKLLKNLAEFFATEFPEGLYARYGGDRFVMIYRNQGIPKEQWLPQLIEKFQQNAVIPNILLKCGLYENVDKSMTVGTMCDRALLALKSIKHNHEVTYAFFSGKISQQQLKAQRFETKFQHAIDHHEFVVWYQPKYDSNTHRIVGAEALVRWETEEGRISPGEFLPVFEKDGLISKLDEYVFQTVCQQQRCWREAGNPLLPISINLSRNSMHRTDVVERYKKIAEENGIEPALLPIEITESAAVGGMEIKPLVDAFYEAGFPIHMDDFGSGQSSLNELNVFHFDVIKLDKSLIDFIGNPKGNAILRYTMNLSKELGLYMVAEGVETENQLQFLKENGCDTIQGYYYSRPLPLEEYEQKLMAV